MKGLQYFVLTSMGSVLGSNNKSQISGKALLDVRGGSISQDKYMKNRPSFIIPRGGSTSLLSSDVENSAIFLSKNITEDTNNEMNVIKRDASSQLLDKEKVRFVHEN